MYLNKLEYRVIPMNNKALSPEFLRHNVKNVNGAGLDTKRARFAQLSLCLPDKWSTLDHGWSNAWYLRCWRRATCKIPGLSKTCYVGGQAIGLNGGSPRCHSKPWRSPQNAPSNMHCQSHLLMQHIGCCRLLLVCTDPGPDSLIALLISLCHSAVWRHQGSLH